MSFAAAMMLLVQSYAAPPPTPARSFVEQLSAAKAGDRDAQFALGEAFRTGTGTTADREAAISWYRLAASQGDPRASAALGVLLFVKGERKTAVPLIQAAAARGDARALYVLGTAHFNGDGVPKDVAQAYVEMRRAADAGLPQAKRSLGVMEPYVTPADRARAEALRTGTPVPATATTVATAPSYAVPARPNPATIPTAATSMPIAVAARPNPTISPAPIAPRPVYASPLAVTAPPRTVASAPPPLPARTTPTPVAIPAAPRPRPASPAPFAATTGAAGWRVQLGAYGSSVRAETQWTVLAARIPALKPLDHMVAPMGQVWRLQATGLASRIAADALCHEVQDAGGACFSVAP